MLRPVRVWRSSGDEAMRTREGLSPGALRALLLVGLLILTTACSLVEGSQGYPTFPPSPSPAPSRTPSASSPFPVAYLVVDPVYETGTLWSLDGHILAVYQSLAWAEPGPAFGSITSAWLEPASQVSFAYPGSSAEGTALFHRRGSETTSLLTLARVDGLAGSLPGRYLAVGGLRAGGADVSDAVLYLIDTQQPLGAPVEPVLLWSLPEPGGLRPLAVRTEGAAAREVFFAFQPREGDAISGLANPLGLYRFILSSGEVEELLRTDFELLGLSADLTWAATTVRGESPPQVQIRRLDGSSMVVFQPLARTLYVGSAVFSPDGRRVAWATHFSDQDGTTREIVSMASTFGGPILQVGEDVFGPYLEGPLSDLLPAAWLSGDVLLVQTASLEGARLFRLNEQGGVLGEAGQGAFVGLVYP